MKHKPVAGIVAPTVRLTHLGAALVAAAIACPIGMALFIIDLMLL